MGKGGAEIIFFNKCGDGGGGFEGVEENLWWGGGWHHGRNHAQVNLALILFFYEKCHEEMLCEPVTNISMVIICHLEKCFWKLSLTHMHCG